GWDGGRRTRQAGGGGRRPWHPATALRRRPRAGDGRLPVARGRRVAAPVAGGRRGEDEGAVAGGDRRLLATPPLGGLLRGVRDPGRERPVPDGLGGVAQQRDWLADGEPGKGLQTLGERSGVPWRAGSVSDWSK